MKPTGVSTPFLTWVLMLKREKRVDLGVLRGAECNSQLVWTQLAWREETHLLSKPDRLSTTDLGGVGQLGLVRALKPT
jgi:hypothetical protein